MTALPICNQRLPATKEQVVCLDVGLICSFSLSSSSSSSSLSLSWVGGGGGGQTGQKYCEFNR